MESINRKLLKENAKRALKNNFWIAFAVVFVGAILGYNWSGISGAGGSAGSTSYNTSSMSTQELLEAFAESVEEGTDSDFDYTYNAYQSEAENIERFMDEMLASLKMDRDEFFGAIGLVVIVIIVIVIIISLILAVIQFVFGSFVSAPTGVGVNKFFMMNRKNMGQFKDMFSGFGKGKYMKTVKTMFSANISMFLWSLLFYFPGLVKYYQYYFVSYIMAENPEISPKRAKEISKQMSDGHKWEIFVLELSFLGWLMLVVLLILVFSLISCGLLALPSLLFAYPLAAYQHATFAELYAERREYAIMTGISSESELIGF